jgi:hypothetical protein
MVLAKISFNSLVTGEYFGKGIAQNNSHDKKANETK